MWLHDTSAGTTADVPWYQQLIPIIGQGLQVYNQQQILDYNLSQLKAGKPGLTSAQLSTLLQQTTPGINVGLSDTTQNLVMYALGGIGIFAVIYMLTKSSSRRV